jgi:predicted metal-dependent phosphoesterase TrpH
MTSDWRSILASMPADALVDTHTHTLWSDGTDTPAKLIQAARAEGLAGVAITDHDSISGYNEAVRLFLPPSFLVLPGIELTAYTDGFEVHVLGYGFDVDDADLNEYLIRFGEARVERAERIFGNLADHGVAMSWEDFIAKYPNIPVGRVHIARELVAAGHCANLRAAFERWLGDGNSVLAPKFALTVGKAASLLHKAGGKAVVAHPGALPPQVQITPLLTLGVDGIEARYPFHHPMQEREYLRYAAKRGVPVTGGSDYHGGNRRGVFPGARSTTVAELRSLLEV